MKFNKDYEKRSHVDNHLQVLVKSGTEVEVKELMDFPDGTLLLAVTTERPCTKNGDNKFHLHISSQELSSWLSEVEIT